MRVFQHLTQGVFLTIPRSEYPRPQFERKDWVNLNGEWSYTFDFSKSGDARNLQQSVKKGGCGECQTSCQSACKTSCTVGNQSCEQKK